MRMRTRAKINTYTCESNQVEELPPKSKNYVNKGLFPLCEQLILFLHSDLAISGQMQVPEDIMSAEACISFDIDVTIDFNISTRLSMPANPDLIFGMCLHGCSAWQACQPSLEDNLLRTCTSQKN